jgi:hypothetical protein
MALMLILRQGRCGGREGVRGRRLKDCAAVDPAAHRFHRISGSGQEQGYPCL